MGSAFKQCLVRLSEINGTTPAAPASPDCEFAYPTQGVLRLLKAYDALAVDHLPRRDDVLVTRGLPFSMI